MISFLFRAVPAVLLFGSVAAFAADPTPAMSQTDFEARVHAYLITHPEVINEMNGLLRAKQMEAQQEKAKQTIGQKRGELFALDCKNAADSVCDPVGGNAEGDVTIVEFFDYECPFCKALAPDLAKVVAEDKHVRVVYKEFPILGEGSQIAAKAALAATRQGKFQPLHDALLADKTPEHQLKEEHILALAQAAGIDVERLKQDMASAEVSARIAATMGLARDLGIHGTPGMLVGDHLNSGIINQDTLRQQIRDARTKTADAH